MYDSSQIGFTLTSMLRLAHKSSAPRDFRDHLLKRLSGSTCCHYIFLQGLLGDFYFLSCYNVEWGREKIKYSSSFLRVLCSLPLHYYRPKTLVSLPSLSKSLPPSQSTNIYPAFMYLQPSTKMNESGQSALKCNGNLGEEESLLMFFNTVP